MAIKFVAYIEILKWN